MFSKLGTTIPPFLRQAESTDTHQYIRRHERDQGRRKNFENHDADADNYDDEASVSVEALLLFLESMASATGHKTHKATISNEHEIAHNKATSPASPSLYAAHAYAHAAKTSPVSSSEAATPSYPPDQATIQTTDSAGNTLITDLITEVRALKDSGVKMLYIERGDSFADSLFQAIEKARTP